MVKLTIAERRLIAIHRQYGGKYFTDVVNMGFSERQVKRWQKVNYLALDAEFEDAPRSGRPHVLSEADEAKVRA